MKQIKYIFIVVLLFCLLPKNISAQQLSSFIEVTLVDSQRVGQASSNEYHLDMYSRVYVNGVLQADRDTQFTYTWYYRDLVAGQTQFSLRKYTIADSYYRTDGHFDTTLAASIFDYYCVVTNVQTSQTTISDTVRVPYYSIIVDQKKSDNSSYGNIKYWKNGTFANNHTVPDTFLIARYVPKVLLADTNLTITGTEKFYQWQSGVTIDWLNNNNYSPLKLISTKTSQFIPSLTSTFTIKIDSVPLTVSNTLEFADPWLRDSVNAYGKLNRGYDDPIFYKQTAPFSPNTNSSGTGSEYRGVFLNQNPLEEDVPYYSVRTKKNGEYNGNKIYFQNWSSLNAQLTSPTYNDGTYYETPVVFQQNNSSVTANYKGSLFSNQSSAFANTSQRKAISLSTSYGARLFVVYESMGKIWLEYSTNNGATWELGNNRQPINDYTGKLPSLVEFNNSNTLAIIYQDFDGTDAFIIAAKYSIASNTVTQHLYVSTVTRTSNGNSNPVIARSYSGDNNNARLMFAWEQNDGIHYMVVKTDLDTIKSGSFDPSDQPKVSGTDGNSITPSLAGGWTTHYFNFHLAWSQNNSDIKYAKIQQLISSDFETISFGTIENVSSGGGYSSNYAPSIISVVSTSQINDSRIAWRGRRWVLDEELLKNSVGGGGYWEYKCVFRGTPVGGSSPFFHFGGSDVSSSSVNKAGSTHTIDSSYRVGWSQGNGNYYTKNSTLSGQTAIPGLSSGSALQLAQGTDTVRAFVQQTQSGYYTIKQSTSGLSKQGADQYSFNGREGIITIDRTQFYFALGDVVVNGETIPFANITDTTSVNSLETMNALLESKPFVLNETSDFTYGVLYGITDSLTAVSALLGGREISFTVQLVDHNTNHIIGSYDRITFNESNVFQYQNIAYSVVTKGIHPTTVRLRLVVVPNFESQFSIANKTSDDFMLSKRARRLRHITYKGSPEIIDFALSQNFPNPFNPTTTINYALPKADNVVLKVYDILGKEVATLVNDYKEIGRYSVEFDASKFSSGMYVYKLTSGKFCEVKKLILLK